MTKTHTFEATRLIRFIGLQRSGNHAVIHWILSQAEGTKKFINNIKAKDYSELMVSPPSHNLTLISFEDEALPSLREAFNEANGLYSNITNVLLLRDPFNLLASRMKKFDEPRKISHDAFASHWLEYSSEFQCPVILQNKPTVVINYNRWCTCQKYRCELCALLSIPFTDSGINHVPPIAGGSSFDGMSMHDKAWKMDTSNRWQSYRDSPEFRSRLARSHLVESSKRIFDLSPELISWIDSSL